MILLIAALLGVVQGLTEFLPISSSAHLILARTLFGWDLERLGLAFDVACHVGTLLAVVVYFRRELLAMAASLPSIFAPDPDPPARQARLIALGTLPIVVVGLTFGDFIEERLRTPEVAAVALAVGAFALLAAERAGTHRRDEGTLSPLEALAFGCAQSLALVPGVSRSGATIVLGLFLGLRRDAAARFSFLLGVPAILAAAGKAGLELSPELMTPGVGLTFAVGILSSAIVGYLTVKYFLRYLTSHSLAVFAWYRLALAAAVPIWRAL